MLFKDIALFSPLHTLCHTQDTIYEYYVDTKNKSWASFEDKLLKSWRYPAK